MLKQFYKSTDEFFECEVEINTKRKMGRDLAASIASFFGAHGLERRDTNMSHNSKTSIPMDIIETIQDSKQKSVKKISWLEDERKAHHDELVMGKFRVTTKVVEPGSIKNLV